MYLFVFEIGVYLKIIYNFFFNILIKLNVISENKLILNEKNLNVLAIRSDGIGDLILTIPSFFMIKKMYPTCKLTLLVNNYNIDIIKYLPYIDNCISYDKYTFINLKSKLNNFNFDVLICFNFNKFVYKVIRNLHIPIKIGPLSKFESFYTFNYSLSQNRSLCLKNEAEYNLDLIKSLNKDLFLKEKEINNNIYFNENHFNKAKEFLKKFVKTKKFIIIHPTNNKSCKNIRIKDYCQIIKEILQQFNDIYIVISSSIKDKDTCNKIISYCNDKKVITFINKGGILNLAALINESDMFISTSTGPLHIAASLKKNIIGIYSLQIPTTPIRWGAYNNNNNIDYILLEKIKQKGYYFNDFNYKNINNIISIIKRKLY